MNVKPGDLARVVADPDYQGALGLQVLVIEEGTSSYAAAQREQFKCVVWRVELLESRCIRMWQFHGRWQITPVVLPAGYKELTIIDPSLRPIPPLAEDEAVYTSFPREVV